MAKATFDLDELERALSLYRARSRRPRWRWVRNIGLFLIGMAVPIVVCSTTVMRCFRVVSPGMAPTLKPGDTVLVLTSVYDGRALPRTGQVVLFRKPPQATDEHLLYVKRVVGLPGDGVQVKEGKLLRNDRVVAEPYLPEPPTYEWQVDPCPPNHIIVLGDNRHRSQDSHSWTAPGQESRGEPAPYLAADHLEGRVYARIWPLSRIGTIRAP